jgi:hypothetical protein
MRGGLVPSNSILGQKRHSPAVTALLGTVSIRQRNRNRARKAVADLIIMGILPWSLTGAVPISIHAARRLRFAAAGIPPFVYRPAKVGKPRKTRASICYLRGTESGSTAISAPWEAACGHDGGQAAHMDRASGGVEIAVALFVRFAGRPEERDLDMVRETGADGMVRETGADGERLAVRPVGRLKYFQSVHLSFLLLGLVNDQVEDADQAQQANGRGPVVARTAASTSRA